MTTIYRNKIEKEDLEALEVKGYEGEVHIIDNDDQIVEAVKVLSKSKILGFDTETRPAFKKGKHYNVALLQLAGDDVVFLFQLKKLTDFSALSQLLNDKRILKVGAAIRDDVKKLNHYFPVTNKSFLELQTFVRKYKIEDISLKKMAAIVLGFRISKNQQVSNWEAEPLSEAQVRYAATDAWVSLKIYNELLKNA